MALINCPECGKEVSSQAPACPSCGHPINTNTALAQQQPQQVVVAQQPANSSSAQQMGQAMANPIIEQQQRKSSGGATGALIGAVLGYLLMASSCGMPESVETFTMSLFFWSPVVGLGMILGYFLGKAVG